MGGWGAAQGVAPPPYSAPEHTPSMLHPSPSAPHPVPPDQLMAPGLSGQQGPHVLFWGLTPVPWLEVLPSVSGAGAAGLCLSRTFLPLWPEALDP